LIKNIVAPLCLLAAAAVSLSAESLSYVGTLGSPESAFETTFTLSANDTVTLQTWGFGGGTNAAGESIAAGGFDPLISLFDGPISSATMAVDLSSNPLADSDALNNPPWSYVSNCPPAGTVTIGSSSDCGDDYMQVSLLAGTYTLVLTDAGYSPLAIYDNGALSEGFSDLTGGVFQTCDAGSVNCISPNGNYAVDIVSNQPDLVVTPEPATLTLLSAGLAVLAGFRRSNNRRNRRKCEGATR
jgi:hypothetical protein